ncbi:MAG: neutral/alkaline non-lysosomal ceramidase N-terminal domain-containing protein [Pirellulales bacterium]
MSDRKHLALFFVCLIYLSLPTLAESNSTSTWRAGVAKTKITPDEWMWMSGYGSRDKPASGKLTDLWCKALVLEDASHHRGVIISLDLVGIDRGLSQEITRRLERDHGLARHQIAIFTSHTHTGPAVGTNLMAMLSWRLNAEQRRQIEDYSKQLIDRIVETVDQALRSVEDVNLAWGVGSCNVAVNRRTNVEANVPRLRFEGQLQGPVDHDVPVLAMRTRDGKLRSVLFGYACHATVLSSFEWSGDYPTFAQMELEEKHPDCIALFWAGCGADQNPLPRRTVEIAKHYGRHLANSVEAVLLTSQMQTIDGGFSSVYAEIPLAFDSTPDRASWEASLQSKDPYIVSRAKQILDRWEAEGPPSATYPYPISTWKLGDLQFIALGGEVVVDYALRIKNEGQAKKTWVAAYAHDVMAYIPSRRVLTEGGYEGGGAMVYYGLPAPWSPTVEEQIVREVQRQSQELGFKP